MFDSEASADAEIMERVARGYDYNDRTWPGWDRGIDPATLHQGDPYGCMLAHASGMSYTEARAALKWTDQELHDHGFYQIQDGVPPDTRLVGYEALTHAARDLMRSRQALRYAAAA